MPISRAPAYNLKVVLKETGISADTLRAWERRYGLPKPQRTAGGHRLYSQHDIQLIKWLMARQGQGFSISRAVDLWLERSASGEDPLAEALQEVPQMEQVTTAAASLEALRSEWLNACMAYNAAEAEQVLNQAFALYPVETVVTELLQAALHEIGEGWQQGRTSVQQEHFASALAARRLDTLISAVPAPTRKETLLLACPPEEQHPFPLLLLSLLLSRRGWRVVYLGPDVPLSKLEDTLRAVHPALVVMSAQGLVAAASLRNAAGLAAELGIPFAYGGRIFNLLPRLRELIPGYCMAGSLQAAPAQIELLLEHGMEMPPATPIPASPLAQAYQWNQPHIEAAVREQLQGSPLGSEDLEAAGYFLGKILLASLQLGQLDYLKSDLDWLRGLSVGEKRPVDGLHQYLAAYSAAVRQIMGSTGQPIADWLDAYISEALQPRT